MTELARQIETLNRSKEKGESPFRWSDPQTRTRIKTVALPLEHGGWAFLLEPVVLGLLLAPSAGGAYIAAASVAVFLARNPFKLAVTDLRRRRSLPRTPLATCFAICYVAVATVFFIGALLSSSNQFVIPLAIAAPLTGLQFFYDTRSQSRALVAELAGAVSTGAIAVAIALAGGWDTAPAFGLWAVIVARAVPSILYVRARLRLLREKRASISPVVAAHLAALVAVFLLAAAKFVSLLAVFALFALFCRAAWGLLLKKQPVPAKRIGFQEIGFGAMTIVAIVLGRAIGW